jgi:hypothetical protein
LHKIEASAFRQQAPQLEVALQFVLITPAINAIPGA